MGKLKKIQEKPIIYRRKWYEKGLKFYITG